MQDFMASVLNYMMVSRDFLCKWNFDCTYTDFRHCKCLILEPLKIKRYIIVEYIYLTKRMSILNDALLP